MKNHEWKVCFFWKDGTVSCDSFEKRSEAYEEVEVLFKLERVLKATVYRLEEPIESWEKRFELYK